MNRKRVLTGAILLATLVLPVIAAPREGKSAADPDAAIAEKWIAAWNSHSPDKMAPLFTDDILYEDVAFGEVSHGGDEVRKFAASEFEAIPDLELKLLRAKSTTATEPSNGPLVAPIRACSTRERSFLSEASA
jgi:hypothetical protein